MRTITVLIETELTVEVQDAETWTVTHADGLPLTPAASDVLAVLAGEEVQDAVEVELAASCRMS